MKNIKNTEKLSENQNLNILPSEKKSWQADQNRALLASRL